MKSLYLHNLLAFFVLVPITWTSMGSTTSFIPQNNNQAPLSTTPSSSTLSETQIKVDGRFNTDSISLGQQIHYILTVQYPRKMEAILPDASFDFSPFKYITTQTYPTVSTKKLSRDSVVYVLSSFSVDTLQKIALPVSFIDNKANEIVKNTDTVSLYFKSHLISSLPIIVDIPPSDSDIHIFPVRDYKGWSFIFFFLGIVIFVLGIYFRRPIYIFLTEKRLKKKHAIFMAKYQQMINEYGNSPTEAENIIVYWKKYMEKLMKIPYTKYTQKDFKRLKVTKKIASSIQNVEKLIYGNRPTDAKRDFSALYSFSHDCFEDRIIQLKTKKGKYA